ncbi:MAG: TonB-dependent receptor [Rubrivivax sp.]
MINKTALSLACTACLLQSPLAQAQDARAAPVTPESAAASQSIVVQGNYLSLAAESAMKANVAIRDTPLSVTNYSAEFMKGIESAETVDLFKYMTGVNRGGQSAYDLSLRGFKTTSNDRNALMTEGLPGQVSRFSSPPTIGVDHIEVVKGPASVLYGQAQPGGFVNIVLKKPQESAEQLIEVKGFTYDFERSSFGNRSGHSVGLDTTGPVGEKSPVLYRLVAEDASKDGWRDHTEDKSRYLAPSLSWKVSKSTSLTVIGEYRYRKGAQDLFLPAPNRDIALIPARTNRLQEPGDFVKEEGYSGTLLLTHAISEGVNLRLSARSVRNHDYTQWYDVVALLPDQTTLRRRARIGDNHRSSDYAEASLTLPLQTGFVTHKLLLGLSAGSDELDANRVQFVNGAATGALAKPGPGSLNIDIYNPVYGQAPSHESLSRGTYQRRVTGSEPVGAFVTDFITLSEQWKATVGLRYARERQTFNEIDSSVALLPSRSQTPSDVYPMAGLLYQPDKVWTFYGSYATSFVPIAPNMQNASGVFSFEPERGKQFEIGAKSEMMNGRLYATLAVFNIKKVNTLAIVGCNTGIAGTCMQPVGAESSRGTEFELNYRPNRNWQTTLGYAYVDAKIDKSNAASTAPLEGSQLTNAPKQKFNLWTRYDLRDGVLAGTGLGFGLTHVSDQAGNLPSTAAPKVLRLPAYTVADLVLYYRFGIADLALKVGNVFDKTYYDSVGSTLADLSVVPGAPRTITASMRLAF